MIKTIGAQFRLHTHRFTQNFLPGEESRTLFPASGPRILPLSCSLKSQIVFAETHTISEAFRAQ